MTVEDKLQLLGIQEVTTDRQQKNGTRVFKLPIKDLYCRDGSAIHVGSFKSGYVRRVNLRGHTSCYQLNKRCESEPQYFETSNGLYRKFTTKACELIPNEQDRLEYLISYCLKNYYIKHANFVADGKYVSQWYHDWSVERVTSNKVRELQDRIYELESQVDVADTRATNLSLQNEVLQNKLSNAISPTKYQCGKNKIHDLENKLATINRISE